VPPSVQQATRARRVARHQGREDQVEAEKEHLNAGPSPVLPRPAMEDMLTAPLWPRHVFGKMPHMCRVAYRSLLIELLWDFVNVNVEQPDAETAQARAYGNLHMFTC
jgi:4'-phosphopantetheinyl transferase EntD